MALPQQVTVLSAGSTTWYDNYTAWMTALNIDSENISTVLTNYAKADLNGVFGIFSTTLQMQNYVQNYVQGIALAGVEVSAIGTNGEFVVIENNGLTGKTLAEINASTVGTNGEFVVINNTTLTGKTLAEVDTTAVGTGGKLVAIDSTTLKLTGKTLAEINASTVGANGKLVAIGGNLLTGKTLAEIDTTAVGTGGELVAIDSTTLKLTGKTLAEINASTIGTSGQTVTINAQGKLAGVTPTAVTVGSLNASGLAAPNKLLKVTTDGNSVTTTDLSSFNTTALSAAGKALIGKIDNSGLRPVYTTPVGSLMPFCGTSAPEGWLFAHGQNISRTTYALLFAAIGGEYGGGDGSTTFTLPDTRGIFIIGASGTTGNAANSKVLGVNNQPLYGSRTGTYYQDYIPYHSHTVPAHGHTASLNNTTLGNISTGVGTSVASYLFSLSLPVTVANAPAVNTVEANTSSTNALMSSRVIPASININYIIFTGLYTS